MLSDLEVTFVFDASSDFSIADARPREVCSRLPLSTAAGGGGVEFIVARAEPSVERAGRTGGGEVNRGSATEGVSERDVTSSTGSRGECGTSSSSSE